MTKNEWKTIVRKIYKLVEEDFLPVTWDGRLVSCVDKETDTIWLKGNGPYELNYPFVANRTVSYMKSAFRKNVLVFKE